MTKAELRSWITARKITQQDAATLLGLSRSALMRQLSPSGNPVSRQTEIICAAHDTINDIMADCDRAIEEVDRRREMA